MRLISIRIKPWQLGGDRVSLHAPADRWIILTSSKVIELRIGIVDSSAKTKGLKSRIGIANDVVISIKVNHLHAIRFDVQNVDIYRRAPLHR